MWTCGAGFGSGLGAGGAGAVEPVLLEPELELELVPEFEPVCVPVVCEPPLEVFDDGAF